MSEKKQCQCYTAVQIGTCDEYCDRVSEKKQTAVMWLIEQITYDNGNGQRRNSFDEFSDLTEYINKALQMEREQIEEAFRIATESFDGGSHDENKYYTDTYGE